MCHYCLVPRLTRPDRSLFLIDTPETNNALTLALMRCIWRPAAAAAVPRLALILFQYSQPVLIKHSIRYVSSPPVETSIPYGYWLIVSSVVVYVGLAVCLLAPLPLRHI